MKYFLNVLLALSVIVGGLRSEAAFALTVSPNGHPYCDVKIVDAQDITSRTRESLAADPTGHKALRGCRAAPVHFLKSYQLRLDDIREVAPDVKLDTVQDLLPFYGRFVELTADSLMYYFTDRLVDVRGGYGVGFREVRRKVEAGEKIFGIKTELGEIGLLMQNCANPGATPAEIVVIGNPCLEVRLVGLPVPPPNRPSNVRFGYADDKELRGPAECLTFTRAGSTQVQSVYPAECDFRYQIEIKGRLYNRVCELESVLPAVSEELGFRADFYNVIGSYENKALGTSIWTLPTAAKAGMFVLCIELPDGRIFTEGYDGDDYVDGVVTVTWADVDARAVWQ